MGKIMITGAGGYIGRHCVATARARGHQVVALLRRDTGLWADDTGVETLVADLAAPPPLPEVDAVIHAAASLAGSPAQMQRDTLAATAALLEQLQQQTKPPQLVLVSSIAVYDTMALSPHDVLNETTPTETVPARRDCYCRAKLEQERLLRGSGLNGFILRVGAVFGPDRLWNGHLGLTFGGVLLRLGRRGKIPLSYVENTALALVVAAETPVHGIETLNVVDDDLPDRATYVRAIQASGWPRIVLPVNWRLFAVFASFVGAFPWAPGLLRPAICRARLMPLDYANTRLKTELDLPPPVPFAKAISRSVNRGQND
jgi:nucleoside-diphosphate-sugar epimerase